MSEENGNGARPPDSELVFIGGLMSAARSPDPVVAEVYERVVALVDWRDLKDAWLQEAYAALIEVRARGGVDVLLLRDELRQRGKWSDDRWDLVEDWLETAAPISTLEQHAQKLHDEGVRRRTVQALRVAQLALEKGDETTDQVVAKAQLVLARALEQRQGESGVPEPQSILGILQEPVVEADWLAEGIIPAGGNLLFVGPPKSLKTTGYMELAVAAATGTPFLHAYAVPRPFRTGIVLTEGVKRYAARRIERLAMSRHKNARDLDGWVWMWYRPPGFRLDNPAALRGLAAWAKKLEIEVLFLDPWMSVKGADVDSNQQDDVRPQLDAYAALRDLLPGVTTQLTVHAGKTGEGKGKKVTDAILGSTAFGAWFDCALAFDRKDETSAVTVRTEYKDLPALQPIALETADQEPGLPSNNYTPQGWYRITVSKQAPAEVEKRARGAVLVPALRAFLEENPGCSLRQLRMGVEGKNDAIDAALRILTEGGKAYVEKALKPGLPDRIYLSGSWHK